LDEKKDRHGCLSPVNLRRLSRILIASASLRRAHRSPLLKTFPAKYRSALSWPEGNGGLFPALRAVGLGLRAHLRPAATAAPTLGTLGFTALAPLWFVLKSLVGEKHLFAGSKYKLGAAFRTLQNPIVVFHEPLSLDPWPGREGNSFEPSGPDSPRHAFPIELGAYPLGLGNETVTNPKRLCLTVGLNLGSAAPSRGTNGY
jgi:hypothetical protein